MSHDTDNKIDEASLAAGYEKSDVNLLAITVLAIACVLLVAAFAIGLNDYFLLTKTHIYNDQVATKRSPEVLELEEEQAELLSTYGIVDAENEIYRIPVDKAMNLMLEETTAH